jgi:hypothetical protein
MQQSEEESLEDYVERFLYNLQKTKQSTLNNDTIRTIFLKGIQEEYIDVLNLMGAGDISHFPFADICDLCMRYSRSREKYGKGIRDVLPKVTKSVAGGGVTRIELGNLLENFKTKILGTLSSQLDMFQVKKKQEEEKVVVYIFCPLCCRKKHPFKECPLDNVQGLCNMCGGS